MFLIKIPLRFIFWVVLGAIVLGVIQCVPEQSDINPPQNVEKYY